MKENHMITYGDASRCIFLDRWGIINGLITPTYLQIVVIMGIIPVIAQKREWEKNKRNYFIIETLEIEDAFKPYHQFIIDEFQFLQWWDLRWWSLNNRISFFGLLFLFCIICCKYPWTNLAWKNLRPHIILSVQA